MQEERTPFPPRLPGVLYTRLTTHVVLVAFLLLWAVVFNVGFIMIPIYGTYVNNVWVNLLALGLPIALMAMIQDWEVSLRYRTADGSTYLSVREDWRRASVVFAVAHLILLALVGLNIGKTFLQCPNYNSRELVINWIFSQNATVDFGQCPAPGNYTSLALDPQKQNSYGTTLITSQICWREYSVMITYAVFLALEFVTAFLALVYAAVMPEAWAKMK